MRGKVVPTEGQSLTVAPQGSDKQIVHIDPKLVYEKGRNTGREDQQDTRVLSQARQPRYAIDNDDGIDKSSIQGPGGDVTTTAEVPTPNDTEKDATSTEDDSQVVQSETGQNLTLNAPEVNGDRGDPGPIQQQIQTPNLEGETRLPASSDFTPTVTVEESPVTTVQLVDGPTIDESQAVAPAKLEVTDGHRDDTAPPKDYIGDDDSRTAGQEEETSARQQSFTVSSSTVDDGDDDDDDEEVSIDQRFAG